MISFCSAPYERFFLRVFCAVFLHNLEDAASPGREGGLRWPSWFAGEGKSSREIGVGFTGSLGKHKECTKALV